MCIEYAKNMHIKCKINIFFKSSNKITNFCLFYLLSYCIFYLFLIKIYVYINIRSLIIRDLRLFYILESCCNKLEGKIASNLSKM